MKIGKRLSKILSFIEEIEKLNEYKEACEQKDITGVADALGDIMYVLCNGIMLHGMKDKFTDVYNEIQASNMSKVCTTEEIAKQRFPLAFKGNCKI